MLPGSSARIRSYTSAAAPPSPILSTQMFATCIRTSTWSSGLASAAARRSSTSTHSSQRPSWVYSVSSAASARKSPASSSSTRRQARIARSVRMRVAPSSSPSWA